MHADLRVADRVIASLSSKAIAFITSGTRDIGDSVHITLFAVRESAEPYPLGIYLRT